MEFRKKKLNKAPGSSKSPAGSTGNSVGFGFFMEFGDELIPEKSLWSKPQGQEIQGGF